MHVGVCVWKGCACVQKQKCKFGALQHFQLHRRRQVSLKRNLHFAKPLQRAAHPMERCPVYFLNHANAGQPHSSAPKLGGFRLPCGIPASTERWRETVRRGGDTRQAWPVNGKHLSHCAPLAPPCYAFPPSGHMTQESCTGRNADVVMEVIRIKQSHCFPTRLQLLFGHRTAPPTALLRVLFWFL